ncbi:MAG: hypothetical protein HY080_16465 [Gammaproteobacteria bacterium]|nr:hypothetical protein [Gammaproteobacteria bacterium]
MTQTIKRISVQSTHQQNIPARGVVAATRFRVGLFGLALCFVSAASPVFAAPPSVIYTDILSGPTLGGENGKGAYLSIFGKNFGNSLGGLSVSIGNPTVGWVAVDNYRYLGPSKGRTDIQQLSVQVGALPGLTYGTAYGIKVSVGGVDSNTDVTFTPNPGNIWFVDNVSGSDTNPGTFTAPFQNIQTTDPTAGAYGVVQPGDVIVVRGRGVVYNTLGLNNCWLRFLHKSGSAPTGAVVTGPITVMNYPGPVNANAPETVNVFNNSNSAISGVDRSNPTYSDGGAWVTLSGLNVEGDAVAGVINVQIMADHWRIVNNDLNAQGAGNIVVKAAGVTGNGTAIAVLGNSIHDILGSGGENHGVYVDGGSSAANDGFWDIGYNDIARVNSGYGILQYNNGTNGPSSLTNNLSIHHNLIHDGLGKSGIGLSDNTGNNINVWNNIIYNNNNAGIRFNTNTLHGCLVYNNTLYQNNTAGSAAGELSNDWNFPTDALDVENNIVYPRTGMAYAGGTVDFGGTFGTVTNNLWYNGSGATLGDSSLVLADPQFVTPGTDFHLLTGSMAIDTGSAAVSGRVVDDYDARSRPQGAGYDIGAYEY